jgi:hypothetical protein
MTLPDIEEYQRGYLGCRNGMIDAGEVSISTGASYVDIPVRVQKVFCAFGVVVKDSSAATAPAGSVTDGVLRFSFPEIISNDTLQYLIVGV